MLVIMLPVIASATRPAVGYITGDCVLMHVRYLLTRSFLYAHQLSERFIEDRKIQLITLLAILLILALDLLSFP